MEWYYILIIILGILLFFIIVKLIANSPKSPLISDLSGKIILITGASAGIGKETAIGLLDQGATVICASRSEEKTFKVLEKSKNKKNGVFYKLDLSSFNSIIELVEKIKIDYPNGIDMLINNAGQIFTQMTLTENNIERTLHTNHIGQFILTGMLINKIKPNGKVINVSSAAHQFPKTRLLENLEKDIEFSNLRNYYNFMGLYSFTKLANIIHAKFIAKNFPNIITASLHPGFVDSDIWNSATGCFKFLSFVFFPLAWLFMKTEKMGAQTTLYLAYETNEKIVNGGYYDDCKLKNPVGIIKQEDIERRILKYTKNIVETHFSNMPSELRKHLDLIDIMGYGSA